jgi:hypothetical protein
MFVFGDSQSRSFRFAELGAIAGFKTAPAIRDIVLSADPHDFGRLRLGQHGSIAGLRGILAGREVLRGINGLCKRKNRPKAKAGCRDPYALA